MNKSRALAILFVTLFLTMMSFGLIIPNLAYYAEDLHASKAQVGWLMAIYSVFQFLFAPLWGMFSDRFGRRPTILIGLAGNAVGLWIFGSADTLPMLFVARSISGILAGAALPTCMAYVADITDEKGRGRGMGLMGAAIGLGFIFGPPVGGIVGQFGHGTPFLLAAGLTAATLLFATLFLRESLDPGIKRSPEPRMVSPMRALRDRLAPYYVVTFFVPFTMAGLETTLPFLARENVGIDSVGLGWMLGIMGAAVAVVQGTLLGRLINVYGERTVLFAGLLVNAAGFFLITTAAGIPGMTVYLVITGVGNQIMRPTTSSLISKQTSLGHGTAIGLMSSMDSLGRVFGPFAAGHLYELHPRLPYYFGALVLSLVFIGLGVATRPPDQQESGERTGRASSS